MEIFGDSNQMTLKQGKPIEIVHCNWIFTNIEIMIKFCFMWITIARAKNMIAVCVLLFHLLY